MARFPLIAQVALDDLLTMPAVVSAVLFGALAGRAAVPLARVIGAEGSPAPLAGASVASCGRGWEGAGVAHRLWGVPLGSQLMRIRGLPHLEHLRLVFLPKPFQCGCPLEQLRLVQRYE